MVNGKQFQIETTTLIWSHNPKTSTEKPKIDDKIPEIKPNFIRLHKTEEYKIFERMNWGPSIQYHKTIISSSFSATKHSTNTTKQQQHTNIRKLTIEQKRKMRSLPEEPRDRLEQQRES